MVAANRARCSVSALSAALCCCGWRLVSRLLGPEISNGSGGRGAAKVRCYCGWEISAAPGDVRVYGRSGRIEHSGDDVWRAGVSRTRARSVALACRWWRERASLLTMSMALRAAGGRGGGDGGGRRELCREPAPVAVRGMRRRVRPRTCTPVSAPWELPLDTVGVSRPSRGCGVLAGSEWRWP